MGSSVIQVDRVGCHPWCGDVNGIGLEHIAGPDGPRDTWRGVKCRKLLDRLRDLEDTPEIAAAMDVALDVLERAVVVAASSPNQSSESLSEEHEYLRSLQNPHPDTLALANEGFEDWWNHLPPCDEDLFDMSAVTRIKWVPGEGGWRYRNDCGQGLGPD